MKNFLKNSLRRQIIIGVSLTHAVLILYFVFDMVARQSRFLHQEYTDTTEGLAQALATNSVVWTLARDYSGLQEVILAQKKYPNVKLVMAYGLDGKIWAHSDSSKIGQYVDATKNLKLLSPADKGFLAVDEKSGSISSVKNIESNGVVLGKVWVVLSEEKLHHSEEKIVQDGFLYSFIAIFTGTLLALIVTNAMTKRLKKLVLIAEGVRRGETNLRVRLASGDELGRLGEAFDSMLEALENKQKVLEKSQAVSEAASQVKSEFLANMSHEIRTPINTMVGMADVLADTPLSDEQHQLVRAFQRAGENLTNLVNDILDLSKIEAGQLKINNEPFSVAELINDLSMLYKDSALRKNLELRFSIDANIPKLILGDKDRIRQILMNLISNAIKFTNKGYVEVVASNLSQEDRTHFIQFAVADTGIGIPDDKKGILFERFQQVDGSSSRKVGGTGLGLAISKKLVEMMNGHIGFESCYATGSKFFFSLPLKEIFESERLQQSQRLNSKKSETSIVSSQQKIILLADDSEDNRMLVKAYLKALPVDIVECNNGVEAFDLFKKMKFDLVLLDLQMPILDGYESIRLIRDWEGKNRQEITPVFALSADSLPELVEKAISSGCDRHISKPVRKKTLIEIVENTFFS
ncbi:MAG: ATP-binding protein [Pseudobdellovibrionaceae bacterium]